MAAIIAAHPSATLQRELNRQIKSTQSIHETNYTLIVSSVLVALSLTALLSQQHSVGTHVFAGLIHLPTRIRVLLPATSLLLCDIRMTLISCQFFVCRMSC